MLKIKAESKGYSKPTLSDIIAALESVWKVDVVRLVKTTETWKELTYYSNVVDYPLGKEVNKVEILHRNAKSIDKSTDDKSNMTKEKARNIKVAKNLEIPEFFPELPMEHTYRHTYKMENNSADISESERSTKLAKISTDIKQALTNLNKALP